jgi:hypothetical protein
MKQIQFFFGLTTGIRNLLDDVGDRGVGVFDDENLVCVTLPVRNTRWRREHRLPLPSEI